MIPVKWAPVRKVSATALSALTATIVIQIGSALGVTVTGAVASGIVAVAAILAGYLTPAAAPADAPPAE